MPAYTRSLTITYGVYGIGGATERHLDGHFLITNNFNEVTFEYDFTVSGTTVALAAAEFLAAEDAYRIPRLLFKIVQGVTTLVDLDPASNTGFDAVPEIVSTEDTGNTGLSRVYTVRVTIQLPADNISTSGRRESTIEVVCDPSNRRTVNISGVYTALSGNDAKAQYDAEIDGYAATVLSGLGLTNYELLDKNFSYPEIDKVLDFRHSYREILYSQAGSALDNTQLKDQTLTIAIKKQAPGDWSNAFAKRLSEITATYSVTADFNETTDLDSLWDTIKAWIITEVAARFSGSLGLIESTPTFAPDNNQITAVMRFLGADGTRIIELEQIETTSFTTGEEVVPTWTGDPFSAYTYQGRSVLLETIKAKEVYFGVQATDPFAPVSARHPALAAFKRVEIDNVPSRKVERIGQDGQEFFITTIERTATWLYYKPDTGTGGGVTTPLPLGDPLEERRDG